MTLEEDVKEINKKLDELIELHKPKASTKIDFDKLFEE